MTTGTDTPLPPGSAVLAGIPAHLLDPGALSDALRRMGLSPGDRRETQYAGEAACEWSIDYADCPMRVILMTPSERLVQQLHGRYPGSEGRDFAPPEGDVLFLAWPESATRTPHGDLDAVLTTLALLSVFLFPTLIQWRPARLWSSAPELAHKIEKHRNGSTPPVLHLVGFERTGKGPDARIATRGLKVFTGQELTASASLLGAAETVRRLARLVLDMFVSGSILRPETIDGLARGESIALIPLTDGQKSDVVEIVIDRRERGALRLMPG